MTNSMNNIDYVKNLVNEKVKVLKIEEIDQHQISFVVAKNDIHMLLSVLKAEGWTQLSYLSAIDWIDDLKFEVVYIVFNWERGVHVQVRTLIERENPTMDSILPIFPGAKYYEREAHEFFGIAFPGNPEYHKQLILEGWDDIPPLRKDFDPRAYSDKKFPSREYPQDFSTGKGKPSPKAKREAREKRANSLRRGGMKL
jgi:NADH-quinone oxidoreductase subunit C